MFGYSFYRNFKYKMVTHARVFSLIPKIKISDRTGIFLSNSIAHLTKKFGYENMCSFAKIKNESIQLPTKNGKIDFEFMEDFVAELEAQRVAELEAYLTVTGLKDYVLTKEEEVALQNLENLQWQEKYVTGEDGIFNVKNTKNILSTEIIFNSGKTPYLCASAQNNSVASYINYNDNLKDKGNCIFIGGKTFVVSYQESDFFSNDSHNLALYLKQENKVTKKKQLFLSTCIKTSLEHKYSWGNSVSNRKIQKDKIQLPTQNGEIDFEYMETLISAIQKLVIKDLVLWNDKKIEDTRKVIEKNYNN